MKRIAAKILTIAAVLVTSGMSAFAQQQHPRLKIGEVHNSMLLNHLKNSSERPWIESVSILPKALVSDPRPSSWFRDIDPTTPIVLVEQFPTIPTHDRLATAIETLRDRQSNSTYLMFIDMATSIDEIRELHLPDNVRLAFSIRSVDAGEIDYFYEQAGLEYASTDVSIQYSSAIGMAIAQLAGADVGNGKYHLKDWEPKKAYVGIFDDIVYSHASPQKSTKLITEFSSCFADGFPTLDPSTGVSISPAPNSTSTSDVDAIICALIASNCGGSWKWDGMSDSKIEFQAFGQSVM